VTEEKLLSYLPSQEVVAKAQEPDDLKTSRDLLAEVKERAKSSLYLMAKGILGYSRFDPSIHLPLCELLEDENNKRQLIVLPRGWYKTTLATISYPIWRAIRNPNIRILLAQNTATNASAKLASIGSHFERNQLFRALYPELLPTKDCVWTRESKEVNRTKPAVEGTFESAGTGTQVVGRHYDLIIEDDTVAPDLNDLGEENVAPTKEDIGQAIGWHRLVPPLLVHPKESQNLVIGTRWFEHDLISWIKNPENKQGFKVYERAVKETNGKADPEGEITFPAQFDQSTLDLLEGSMGPYMYSCLYLNTPIRSDKAMFQDQWFQYYETEPAGLAIYTTVDLATDPERANKEGKIDFNVILTCGIDLDDGEVYVLNYVAIRANPGEVIDNLFQQVEVYHPLAVGVESVAYQSTLGYWIKQRQNDTGQYFLCEEISGGKKSKAMKIMGLQPFAQAKPIHIKQWMQALRTQLIGFPYTAHDDIADALAMQLNLWPPAFRSARKEHMLPEEFLSAGSAMSSLTRGRTPGLVTGILSDIYRPIPGRNSTWQSN
jgi:predicted phage terminase large subunit-like protein